MTATTERRNDQIGLIERAVAKLRAASDETDYAEMVDWATTVQLRTAELVASIMANVNG